MHVRLSTGKGNLEIELYEREAPLATRCLRHQIGTGAWNSAEFRTVTDDAVKLTGASKSTPLLALETHRYRLERGSVAYSNQSSAELVFCRNPVKSLVTGTIVGKLSKSSLFVLEQICGGPKDGDALAFPIKIGKKTEGAPAPKRKRIEIKLPELESEPKAESESHTGPQTGSQAGLHTGPQNGSQTGSHTGSPIGPQSASNPEGSEQLRCILDFEARLKAAVNQKSNFSI